VAAGFDLTMDELRVVARYVVDHAEEVLPAFERAVSDDVGPRAAIEAEQKPPAPYGAGGFCCVVETQIAWTWSACGPFGPWVVWNSTR
jgi:hypothetical protein